MKILEAKSWLDGHPQFQTESQWAYVMRMLTSYGAAVERAAEAAAIERCAKMCNEVAEEFGPGDWQNASLQCSAAIRALLPKEE